MFNICSFRGESGALWKPRSVWVKTIALRMWLDMRKSADRSQHTASVCPRKHSGTAPEEMPSSYRPQPRSQSHGTSPAGETNWQIAVTESRYSVANGSRSKQSPSKTFPRDASSKKSRRCAWRNQTARRKRAPFQGDEPSPHSSSKMSNEVAQKP